MRLDIGKVNLTEKDIEDWLFENPEDFPADVEYHGETPIVKWIGRQYHLPSGIADLIGLRGNGMLTVVEVKNVAISKAAILQVCRYASDVEQITENRDRYDFRDKDGTPYVQKVIIGPSIDDQTFMEAQACNVAVICFVANLDIALTEISWTTAAYKSRCDTLNEISKQPEWDVLGIHYSDSPSYFSFSSLPTPDDVLRAEEEILNRILAVSATSCASEDEMDGDGCYGRKTG